MSREDKVDDDAANEGEFKGKEKKNETSIDCVDNGGQQSKSGDK